MTKTTAEKALRKAAGWIAKKCMNHGCGTLDCPASVKGCYWDRKCIDRLVAYFMAKAKKGKGK